MTPFDAVLDEMQLRHSLYACLQLGAPWGVSFDTAGYARVVFIREGQCYLSWGGSPTPSLLQAGTCMIIQPGVRFVLADQMGRALVPCDGLAPYQGPEPVRYGGLGALTELVTARFSFNRLAAEPLFGAMGSLIHWCLGAKDTLSLESTLSLLSKEALSKDYGTALITARLLDVLFMQILRAIARTDGLGPGLMAGFKDPQIKQVLQIVHARIAYPWTVEEMGRLIDLPRSTFAALFKAKVGQSPLEYLTCWRMHKTKLLLASTRDSVGVIAGQVGYDNESSLSRAFTRREGISPGGWRAAQKKKNSSSKICPL